jgi:hypothetical protein
LFSLGEVHLHLNFNITSESQILRLGSKFVATYTFNTTDCVEHDKPSNKLPVVADCKTLRIRVAFIFISKSILSNEDWHIDVVTFLVNQKEFEKKVCSLRQILLVTDEIIEVEVTFVHSHSSKLALVDNVLKVHETRAHLLLKLCKTKKSTIHMIHSKLKV